MVIAFSSHWTFPGRRLPMLAIPNAQKSHSRNCPRLSHCTPFYAYRSLYQRLNELLMSLILLPSFHRTLFALIRARNFEVKSEVSVARRRPEDRRKRRKEEWEKDLLAEVL